MSSPPFIRAASTHLDARWCVKHTHLKDFSLFCAQVKHFACSKKRKNLKINICHVMKENHYPQKHWYSFPPLNCACFYHDLMGFWQKKNGPKVTRIRLTVTNEMIHTLTIFGSLFVSQVRWNVTPCLEK